MPWWICKSLQWSWPMFRWNNRERKMYLWCKSIIKSIFIWLLSVEHCVAPGQKLVLLLCQTWNAATSTLASKIHHSFNKYDKFYTWPVLILQKTLTFFLWGNFVLVANQWLFTLHNRLFKLIGWLCYLLLVYSCTILSAVFIVFSRVLLHIITWNPELSCSGTGPSTHNVRAEHVAELNEYPLPVHDPYPSLPYTFHIII